MAGLICKIELNKERGITIEVTNEEGKITSTAHFDGSKITTTVKGSEETSTITQTPESIAIKCKTFTLDAETITCTSTDATKHVAEGTYTVESTKDMTLKSSANTTAEASSAFDVKAADISAKGSSSLALEGMKTDLKADTDVKIEGLNVSAKATTKSEIKGLQVNVQADGTMDVKGAATTVKGDMLQLSGSMVKIG